jgi:hypothetical protein
MEEIEDRKKQEELQRTTGKSVARTTKVMSSLLFHHPSVTPSAA